MRQIGEGAGLYCCFGIGDARGGGEAITATRKGILNVNFRAAGFIRVFGEGGG